MTARLFGLSMLALLAPMALPAAASDGERLASEHGCLNCHGRQVQGELALSRLTDKMARDGDKPEALQHMLDEMRGKSGVHAHVMVSDGSALAILQWMAQGAK